MRELMELQARFGAALDPASSGAEVSGLFQGNAGSTSKRFGIYRGNARATIAKVLAAAYPVIEKLVGAEFFAGLAREYEKRFPSVSGDLNEYGDSFADFLAGFEPAGTVPYLADMARLEWRVHRAHYAADAAPYDATRLAAVEPEQQLALRPVLHPACSLVRSEFPLARIWEVHQPGFDGEMAVDFSGGPAFALVHRPRFRVQVRHARDDEAAFLNAAAAGGTLLEALAAAQSWDESFDLGRSLVEWVGASVIVDFLSDGGRP